MYKSFLIKYAEIAIKGKNRYLFEDALVSQINHALKKADGEFLVRKEQGRIYVDTLSDYDYPFHPNRLSRISSLLIDGCSIQSYLGYPIINSLSGSQFHSPDFVFTNTGPGTSA